MFALVVLAVLAGAHAANVNKHMKMLELDNHIQPHLQYPHVPRTFLELSRAPPALNPHEPGTTLALTCEVFSAPAPSVRWFKNNRPVYEYDQDSNEIFDTNPTSVARTRSTLLVTRTDGRDEYTCVASSGARTAHATSVVYSTDGSTDFLLDRARLIPLEPQILVWHKVFIDLMGSSVVLPCHAKGHPRPQVTWKNNKGEMVEKDPRMKVLHSGELVISPLLWRDMGEFICQATNAFGTAEITTFVYPATLTEVKKRKH